MHKQPQFTCQADMVANSSLTSSVALLACPSGTSDSSGTKDSGWLEIDSGSYVQTIVLAKKCAVKIKRKNQRKIKNDGHFIKDY